MSSSLGDRFMELYQKVQIPNTELSKMSGVSTSTISRIVNGSNSSADTLQLLVNALENYIANMGLDAIEISPPQNATNADFSAQFDSLQGDYEERCRAIRAHYEHSEKLLIENYEKRISDLKAMHEEYAAAQERNITYFKRRLHVTMALFALFGAGVLALTIIDLLNGNVGWRRFAYPDLAAVKTWLSALLPKI